MRIRQKLFWRSRTRRTKPEFFYSLPDLRRSELRHRSCHERNSSPTAAPKERECARNSTALKWDSTVALGFAAFDNQSYFVVTTKADYSDDQGGTEPYLSLVTAAVTAWSTRAAMLDSTSPDAGSTSTRNAERASLRSISTRYSATSGKRCRIACSACG